MKIRTAALAAALLAATPSFAQAPAVAERAPDATKVVPIYPGTAPGSEGWTWREQVSEPPYGGAGGRLVRNVVQPTLSVFPPLNVAANTGAAVIVAPGGGNIWLSIDSEGYDVARALAARGVTAFVLKYRLTRTAEDETAFKAAALALVARINGETGPAAVMPAPPPMPPAASNDPSRRPAVADGMQAVRYVREHAAEFGVDPHRIGMVGFSAGGGVTTGALRFGQGVARPDFAGVIYAGGPADVVWATDLPPVFIAVAGDDAVAGEGALTLFNTLRAQRHPAELHVYASGGHGFGMQAKGVTTDLWFDQFVAWMSSQGFLKGPAAPPR